MCVLDSLFKYLLIKYLATFVHTNFWNNINTF